MSGFRSGIFAQMIAEFIESKFDEDVRFDMEYIKEQEEIVPYISLVADKGDGDYISIFREPFSIFARYNLVDNGDEEEDFKAQEVILPILTQAINEIGNRLGRCTQIILDSLNDDIHNNCSFCGGHSTHNNHLKKVPNLNLFYHEKCEARSAKHAAGEK